MALIHGCLVIGSVFAVLTVWTVILVFIADHRK